MEHLLHSVYERQAHLLKSLEERYTGRPIYEHPLSFNTERGEMKRSRAVKDAHEEVAGKGKVVHMPKKDYMSEHHSLIKMLEDISSKAGKEAKKQSKEIKGKGKRCINNIDGGCGMCGGTDGEIVLEKGGTRRREPPPSRAPAPAPAPPAPVPRAPPSSRNNSPQQPVGQFSPMELEQRLERVREQRGQNGQGKRRRKH